MRGGGGTGGGWRWENKGGVDGEVIQREGGGEGGGEEGRGGRVEEGVMGWKGGQR